MSFNDEVDMDEGVEETKQEKTAKEIDSVIESLGESGELEVEKVDTGLEKEQDEPSSKEPDEDTKAEEDKSEKTTVTIGGKEYTHEELSKMVDDSQKARDVELQEKWKKDLTEKNQKLAEERTALEKQRNEFFSKMKESAKGDEVLEEALDIIKEQSNKLDVLEEKMGRYEKIDQEHREAEEARNNIIKYAEEARKAGYDIPDVDSPEFKLYLEGASKVTFNPLMEFAKTISKKPKASEDGPKDLGGKKPQTNYMGYNSAEYNRIMELAKAMGRKPANIKKYMGG